MNLSTQFQEILDLCGSNPELIIALADLKHCVLTFITNNCDMMMQQQQEIERLKKLLFRGVR